MTGRGQISGVQLCLELTRVNQLTARLRVNPTMYSHRKQNIANTTMIVSAICMSRSMAGGLAGYKKAGLAGYKKVGLAGYRKAGLAGYE